MIAPTPDKLRQPEGYLALALLHALEGRHAEALGIVGDRWVSRLTWRSRGSANWAAIQACLLAALGDPEELRAYCLAQLGRPIGGDRPHGLGHIEPGSTRYPWPAACLAGVHDRLRPEDRRLVRDLLAAWALAYGLGATSDAQSTASKGLAPETGRKGPNSAGVEVVMAGARSHPYGHELRSAIFAGLLWPEEMAPREAWWHWPLRVQAHGRQTLLPDPIRDLLRRQIAGGDVSEEIAARLRGIYGGEQVHRWPIRWQRHSDGVLSAMGATTGSTPACCLVARVGDRTHAATPHPEGWRGGRGKRVGRPEVVIGEGCGSVTFHGAVLRPGESAQDIRAEIPLPAGPVVWAGAL